MKLVLPVATAASATVITASLVTSKKIDSVIKDSSKEQRLKNFVTLNEDFEEKIITHALDETKEEVSAEDVKKAEEVIENLKKEGAKDELPFESKEEAIKFLNEFPEKTLSELLKKSNLSNDDLSKLTSNESIQSGKLGAAIKEQNPQFAKEKQPFSKSSENDVREDASSSEVDKSILNSSDESEPVEEKETIQTGLPLSSPQSKSQDKGQHEENAMEESRKLVRQQSEDVPPQPLNNEGLESDNQVQDVEVETDGVSEEEKIMEMQPAISSSGLEPEVKEISDAKSSEETELSSGEHFESSKSSHKPATSLLENNKNVQTGDGGGGGINFEQLGYLAEILLSTKDRLSNLIDKS